MAKKLLRECIIIGGKASGGHVLGKARDRNYAPHLEIIRDLTSDGLEVDFSDESQANYYVLVLMKLLI